MSQATPYPLSLHIGSRTIPLKRRAYIMGVLNVTPDSFSDGGLYESPKKAFDRAIMMCDEGADFIDIGGESSRPGSDSVGVRIEIKRILPVLKRLRKRTKVWISVDTTKAEVARVALSEGADLINDVSALRDDPEMSSVIAEWNVPIVLMHRRGKNAKEMQKKARYACVIKDICADISRWIKQAKKNGIRENQIIIDPGIGFGKTARQNLEILRHLDFFQKLRRPILVGTSRKSFIGKILGHDDPNLRLGGSLGSVIVSVLHGAHIVRVHDVRASRDACRMAEAIMNS